jgi:UPF0755 protein
MKKNIKIAAFITALVLAFAGWNVFGPVVSAPKEKYFYIKSGSGYDEVKNKLSEQHILNNFFFFDIISKRVGYNYNIKAGRYIIKNGSNIISLIRMLKSGNQAEVRLVINKIRTKEEFAGKIGNNFEADSTEAIRFLLSNDSLAPYHLDTNTVMTIIIPNSYLFWWNGSFKKIFERLKKQNDYFWEGERTLKAKSKGYTPEQIYTIASIVEEETNMEADKGKIASVYFNRIDKNMKLEADPTVKYAMRDFRLKRILHGHLDYPSKYNTYYKTGFPPGPICTPSINTIDAVLNAPKTDYIFFVAKPDFGGYSNFASTYSEHLQFAKVYQAALDNLFSNKSQQKP